MIRYTIQYKLPGQPKETRTSPFVASRREAAVWLIKQKPALLDHLETLSVKQYQVSDPK